MRKTIALLLAAGTLAAPAAAVAGPGVHHPHHARTVSRQACAAERQLLGNTAFRLKYGATNAARNCVKGLLPSARAAAKACRTERRTLGPAAFKAKYGGPAPLNGCIKRMTKAA